MLVKTKQHKNVIVIISNITGNQLLYLTLMYSCTTEP